MSPQVSTSLLTLNGSKFQYRAISNVSVDWNAYSKTFSRKYGPKRTESNRRVEVYELVPYASLIRAPFDLWVPGLKIYKKEFIRWPAGGMVAAIVNTIKEHDPTYLPILLVEKAHEPLWIKAVERALRRK